MFSLQRSLKLFFIGLLIHTAHGPDFEDIRIMGVLQRFGIAYFVIASLQVICRKSLPPSNSDNEEEPGWKSLFIDITSLSLQWFIMIIIIVVHLLIIFCLPVPNCETGYLGPGGMHEMGRYNNCIGGAAGYIDRLLISSRHLYQRPHASHVYDEKIPFDPEGPFGSLLTIVQVFFGVQCGYTLLLFSKPFDRIKRWFGWGLTTLLLGLCLCKFSVNNGVIPLNKNLWSLSFVFVTTGFAFLLLSGFYLIIDVQKWWTGKPLTFAGMNAILMYIGSELLGQMYPFYWQFSGTNTHFMFLSANLWNAAMWNIVAYYLFLRKIFFSL